MHEFSIAQSLFKLIEKYALENKARKVIRVKVTIGKLSGIELSCLEFALQMMKENTIAQSADFLLKSQDVVILCEECHKKTTLENNVFQCSSCGSNHVQMIQGGEMILESLELEE